MPQKLKALAVLAEAMHLVPSACLTDSHVTPVPEDLASSLGFWGHHMHVVYRHACQQANHPPPHTHKMKSQV